MTVILLVSRVFHNYVYHMFAVCENVLLYAALLPFISGVRVCTCSHFLFLAVLSTVV